MGLGYEALELSIHNEGNALLDTEVAKPKQFRVEGDLHDLLHPLVGSAILRMLLHAELAAKVPQPFPPEEADRCDVGHESDEVPKQGPVAVPVKQIDLNPKLVLADMHCDARWAIIIGVAEDVEIELLLLLNVRDI